MIEQQHRSARRHRQTCAFGYLTVAPIDGHLGPRQARDGHVLPSERVDAGLEPARPAPVMRRITRRVVEAVE